MKWAAVTIPLAVMVALGFSGHRTEAAENGRIAFGRGAVEDPVNGIYGGDVYSMNPDGTDVRQLTDFPGVETPWSWSPDGSRLLFTSDQTGRPEIWVMDPDGSNKEAITDFGGDMPDWSPDGQQIAFLSPKDGPLDLYLMDADGSNVRRLGSDANGYELGAQPKWSPDGSRILYYRATYEVWTPDLCLMNPDGSGQTNLTLSPEGEFLGDWSPDGEKIVYTALVAGEPVPYYMYIMDADGSNMRLLGGVLDPEHPSWSPDGKQIAYFDSEPSVGQGIYVINADGTGNHRLSPVDQSEYSPVWQPRPPGATPLPRLDPLPHSPEGCRPVAASTPTPGISIAPSPGSLPKIGGSPTPSEGRVTRVVPLVFAGLLASAALLAVIMRRARR